MCNKVYTVYKISHDRDIIQLKINHALLILIFNPAVFISCCLNMEYLFVPAVAFTYSIRILIVIEINCDLILT